jgi:hypothetical protein
MRRHVGMAAALILAAISPLGAMPAAATTTTTGTANSVVRWDRNAQTAIWDVAQQQPWEQGRSFAMVNGAVYDAVNAIAGKPYQPYLISPRTTGRESTDAAVATAAYRVLDALFPAQADRLSEQYGQELARIPEGPAKRGGIVVGARTAAAMIASRQNDGSDGDQQWVTGTEPGEWRPTPPTFTAAGGATPFIRPYLIPNAAMFRTAGPLSLGSTGYAADFNEIKQVGGVNSTARTPDQTEAAIWWHDRHVTEWEIKRQLAQNRRLNVLQTARMFAMTDLTVADTGIACFDDKRAWSFWRPVSAIQLAGADGNPGTSPDPDWMPLLVTPPFPDHPSGHTCATAARMAIWRTVLGSDRIAFHAYSEATGTTRYFDSFSEAVDEVVSARVWGGIHFRNASVQGKQLGDATSAYVSARFFKRLHD